MQFCESPDEPSAAHWCFGRFYSTYAARKYVAVTPEISEKFSFHVQAIDSCRIIAARCDDRWMHSLRKPPMQLDRWLVAKTRIEIRYLARGEARSKMSVRYSRVSTFLNPRAEIDP